MLLDSLLVFIASVVGQWIQIVMDFGDKYQDIKNDAPGLRPDDTVIDVFIFYLKSRQLQLFLFVAVMPFVAIISNSQFVTEYFFPTLEGRMVSGLMMGYAGHHLIKKFMNSLYKKQNERIGGDDAGT